MKVAAVITVQDNAKLPSICMRFSHLPRAAQLPFKLPGFQACGALPKNARSNPTELIIQP
jgi:hypothetical protein